MVKNFDPAPRDPAERLPGYVDEIFRGTEVPRFLWVLLPLISLATSLYTVGRVRVFMHGFWRSPTGVTTSSLIRLLGGMICLVAVLIGIALSLDKSRMSWREDNLWLMFWFLALGLLMRYGFLVENRHKLS